MIKFIQNRVWMINHTLAPKEQLEKVDLIHHPFFDMSYRKLDIRSDKEDVISVRFTKDALHVLQKTLDEASNGVQFEDIRLFVNDLGYLNITIVFACNTPFVFSEAEKAINLRVKETINHHLDLFETLVQLLADQQMIVLSSTYHFGVPDILLDHDMHTRKRSYLFNNHYLFIEEDELFDALKEQNPSHQIYLDLPVRLFTINDSQWFWSMKKTDYTADLVDQLLYPNFLALIESQVYSNAMFCYSGYLQLITKGVNVDVSSIRSVININNLKLLKVKMLRPMLRHYQITHIEHHHQFMIQQKFSMYQTALGHLDYALVGKDTEINQKSNRLIQLILSFFSLLTIYSVVTDIYMLVTDQENRGLNNFTSIILGVVTLILLIIIFYLIRHDKKSSK